MADQTGWRTPFQDFANSRPLFLTIHAALIFGVIFSSFYVFSTLYSSAKSGSLISSFTRPPQLSSQSSLIQSPHFEDKEQNISAIVTPEIGEMTDDAVKPKSVQRQPIWESPLHGSEMPPLQTFKLTKELVQARAEDNIIIVTFGNYAFMDFILTWTKHLTDLGLSNILVGALDTSLLTSLYWKGIPVFDMGSHMSTVDAGWGSPTFHKIGREKVILIDSILSYGFELLMCDTDMVWLKNPLPYFSRFAEADVLTSTDEVSPTVVDDGLEIWNEVNAAYNIGIFHWRPTNSSKKLAKEWKNMVLGDDKIWDQNGFNDIVKARLGPSVDESGIFYAFDGKFKLGLLPASIFCSGHTYFVQSMYQQLGLDPYAVHTTFQFAGTEGKRHRLREAMVFYDPPEYFDSPGGFLSFKPSIPKRLLLDGEHNIESHFSLINYQMKHIRTALEIASLLNRTLVMPPIWCRLDRLWFGHPGVLVGSMTRQPFLCPLDHVFEVNVMLENLSDDKFGPGIDIREYSFFNNPSFQKKMKESWLEVHVCKQGSPGCHKPNATKHHGMIKFPTFSDEETFKQVFLALADVKVLEFSSMQEVFPGFTDEVRREKFRNRVKRYVGMWCCVENHTPGHIYYDMYWDEIPGWRPSPPNTPEDDHPHW